MIYRLIPVVIVLMFCSCSTEDTQMKDQEGNIYGLKKFGDTYWMLENLRVESDITGNPVKFYYPDNSKDNAADYGLLYDYESACKACPSGWQLPDADDWERLFESLHDSAAAFKDTEYWHEESSTNSTQFSVRPSGYGNTEYDNFFNSKSIFWAHTANPDKFAWAYILEKESNEIRKAEQHTDYAFSVRCVRK